MSKKFVFAVESDPTYLVFCFQPVYVLTCFELFCLPFSMFVPYFRSSEISWRKKLHHKVTVPFHIYMPCIYGTFHSYSFRAIVSIYLCYYEKKSSNIWDLRNLILLEYNYLYNLYFHPSTKTNFPLINISFWKLQQLSQRFRWKLN